MFRFLYHCFSRATFSKYNKYFWIPVLVFLSILISACKDAQVNDGVKSSYTVEEVRKMMAYHGALVARFCGGHWWALSKGGWVRIESGGAYNYALLSRVRDTGKL